MMQPAAQLQQDAFQRLVSVAPTTSCSTRPSASVVNSPTETRCPLLKTTSTIVFLMGPKLMNNLVFTWHKNMSNNNFVSLVKVFCLRYMHTACVNLQFQRFLQTKKQYPAPNSWYAAPTNYGHSVECAFSTSSIYECNPQLLTGHRTQEAGWLCDASMVGALQMKEMFSALREHLHKKRSFTHKYFRRIPVTAKQR
jgi:hypothetical protein